MLPSSALLKAQLSYNFFVFVERNRPQILTGIATADLSSSETASPTYAGPNARRSSAQQMRGPMIVGLILVALIEFTIQFLILLFFGWVLMKVLDVGFLYFAIAAFAFFFMLAWLLLYPSMLANIDNAARNARGRPLSGSERAAAFRQFLVGYMINLIITFVAILLVAKILGVPVEMPGGQPLPAANLDTSEIATTLTLAVLLKVFDALFGTGQRAAQLPYG